MRLYPEELALSREYAKNLPFEQLTEPQLRQLEDHGRRMFRWFKDHPHIHNSIAVCVLVFLFGADYWVLLELPRWFLPEGQAWPTAMIVAAGAISGTLHSYLMYSMAVYSVHEAFTHRVMFQQIGPISKWAHRVAGQLCRVATAEPHHYSVNHLAHHGKFGAEDDGEFLNFVRPRRYWLTWLPFATLYSDFACHRPGRYTRSRILTATLTLLFNGVYTYFIYQSFGLLFTILVMVVFFPHVGFYLDRARQFTEHNLMPPENTNGSRSFGWGFWGVVLGGGPWGTPCHLEHHLVPQLPWYHQLMLHRYLRSILTPRQRQQFLVQPVVGWPKLWWRLIREPNVIERGIKTSGFPSA